MNTTLYDQNNYYAPDGSATRLSRLLNPLLHFLDWLKVALLIRKLSPPKGNVLDIGAGDGKFLYFLKNRGFSPYGTTASKCSQDAAREKFGVNIEYALDLPQSLERRKYQLLTYWHVFEHLLNPEEHAHKWPILLENGGTLVIEVPSPNSLGAWWSFNSWLGSDVKHHPNLLNEAQLSNLLNKVGLKIIRSEGFSLKFSYPYLWSSLLGALYGKLYDFDFLLDLLKNPWLSFKRFPGRTLNALAALVYLLPLILVAIPVGLCIGKGEVLRIYAKKA